MIPLNEVSTPALAYLGDCVLELLVRQELVARGLSRSGHLHTAALEYVRASAQAAAVERILPVLTPQEEQVYKRGRNSGHLQVPKSARPAEYRAATGMEVLFGYLHLAGEQDRIRALFVLAYPGEAQSQCVPVPPPTAACGIGTPQPGTIKQNSATKRKDTV